MSLIVIKSSNVFNVRGFPICVADLVPSVNV